MREGGLSMDGGVAGADSVMDNSATAWADPVTVLAICPACGYPTLGSGLCAYCRPPLTIATA